MYLRNTTALITGGAQGFGKAFARIILEAGGKVSLLDILPDHGLQTQNEFNAQFGNGSALFMKCDVQKPAELETAFKKTHDIFGSLDLVVNNAGVTTVDGDWEKTIAINLIAVMRGCFLASEYMIKGNGGHIINISSTAGINAVPFDPAYAASKSGVVGLSRCLALMLKSKSIRVNCICPSFTDTTLFRSGETLKGTDDTDDLVKSMGIMSVMDVAAGFQKLLEDENTTGGVMYIIPNRVGYKHKPSKL